MVNIFTTVVIAIASGGLGYLFGWLATRSTTESSKPTSIGNDSIEVRHIRRSMYPTRVTFTEDLE